MHIQVTHPLSDKNLISSRLDAVSEIAEFSGTSKALHNKDTGCFAKDNSVGIYSHSKISQVLDSALTIIRRAPDIQRGITRIFHGSATPSEVPYE